VYDDDSQFEYIEIARGESRDGGAAVVHIYEIEKEEDNGWR